MKKLYTTLAIAITCYCSYAQSNTFPSSGNVGIGITSPNAILTVQGGGTTTGIGNIATTLTARFNTANPPIVLGVGYVSSDNPFMQAFNSVTSSTRSLIINPFGGNVGIGTTTPDVSLAVAGSIHSKEVKVDMNGWSDYVFNKTYHLPKLTDIKTYIDQYHHLPEIPSEQQVIKDGLNLGEMNKLLLKKVEELTLYLIEKDKKTDQQDQQITDLNKQVLKQDQQLAEQNQQAKAQQHVNQSLQEQINQLAKKLKN